jgi:predicted O-linked N-acetylglucosamine transferase (SPINDLY family)
LSLGVPVVAMSGRSIQTRVALSMMNELGIGDLVAPSMEEMLVNLQTLISDSAVRSQWKERFVAAIEADGGSRHARLTAALEAVYAKAYKAKWSVE